jgi:hypothetical protein
MLDIQDNHDGYHTFRELYEHRIALYMALVNSHKESFRKTLLHADGSKYWGWFLVYGGLPSGQISYHIPEKYWNSFKCEEIDKCGGFDGHTSKDVVDRLIDYAVNY